MNSRPALALVGAAFLFLSVFAVSAGAQTTTMSSSSTSSSNLNITVNPDGSMTLGGVAVSESYSTPGNAPTAQFSASVATSNGHSVATIHATETIPPSELKNLSVTGTVSGQGSYSNGQSSGTITISGSPGVSSPASTLKLTYSGTTSNLMATGSVTIDYGTYTYSGQSYYVGQSNISEYLAVYQSQYNTTTINKAFAQDHITAITANTFSITPSYGSSSATLTVDLGLTGNFTALPGDEIASYCQTSSLASCAAEATLVNAIDNAVTGYTYSFGYSGGTITFDATVTGPTNFNLHSILQAEVQSAETSGNYTAAQQAFLNSTSIDISGLTAKGSVNQSSTGLVISEFRFAGLTLSPNLVTSSGSFDESGFFDSLGTSPVNVTLQTSGGATLSIPSGVPPPTSQTPTSATWTNVQGSALAGVTYSGGTTSTTSSTMAGQSTTGAGQSSTSQSSGSGSSTHGGGIPEFPFQSAAALVLTLAVLAAYLLTRKSSISGTGMPDSARGLVWR